MIDLRLIEGTQQDHSYQEYEEQRSQKPTIENQRSSFS